MENFIPRVAAIHDLSGFGRCSLTVVIPVMSYMGIQVCPLPTAILSTHTDGYKDFFFHDFTDNLKSIATHWKNEGIGFDCIYSGFLGSARQIDIVSDFFDEFSASNKPLIVVDPVMGDQGQLYKTYTDEMQNKMRILVEKADIITPNLTEACFLLGKPYTGEPMDSSNIKECLKALSDMGPDSVVITSMYTEDACFANVGYSRSLNTFWKVVYSCVPTQYPGTGDTFTSVLTGSLLNGDTLPVAIDRATKFVSSAIQKTYELKTPEREGIILEKLLDKLKSEYLFSSYEEF